MKDTIGSRESSRRRFLQEATLAGTTVAVAGLPGAAFGARRRKGRRLDVAVLGGGMAGLAAAHELAERGFRVHVYERNALGGKARSIGVPRTAAGGRKPLPGEHGFRFFPGFYHHVPDSMRKIPVRGNKNGVWDNFRDAMETKSPRTNGRADATLFGVAPDPEAAASPDGLQNILVEELVKQQGVRPDEAEFFANRLHVFLTSSDQRRFGQWEHTTWWDFVRAEGKSDEYKKVIARGLTRSLVAAKETVASTRTIGNMAEAFVMNFQNRGQRRLARPGAQCAHQRGVDQAVGAPVAQDGGALPRGPGGDSTRDPKGAHRLRRAPATAGAAGAGSRRTGSCARCRWSGRADCGRRRC